jgi:hypothetical protein
LKASDEESDNESENEEVIEHVEDVDDNAQFMLEEVMFDFDRIFVQAAAVESSIMLVTDSNTVIIYDDESYRGMYFIPAS